LAFRSAHGAPDDHGREVRVMDLVAQVCALLVLASLMLLAGRR
jgi:hypothetical protein